MQKNIGNKQGELTQFITMEKTKPNLSQDKNQRIHKKTIYHNLATQYFSETTIFNEPGNYYPFT